MPHERVKQSDIAKALNLSVQTVSMALRGHKRISEATRLKVERTARRLGYQADPTMAALANYRTQQARQQSQWDRVALLHDWASKDDWLRYEHYQRLRSELISETTHRGIQLQEFWVGPHGKDRVAVLRKLRNLGIKSILLAPPSEGRNPTPIQIPKTDFHVVTFGPDSTYPDQHVIQFDYYANLRLTWQTLWQRGCRRIGLSYPEDLGWRTNHAWLAAYLAEKQLAGMHPGELPPRIHHFATKSEDLIEWAQSLRLDALISPIADDLFTLQEHMPEVQIASMHQSAREPGVDPNPEHAAFAAIEILQFEMNHALLQKSHFNLRIHIPGKWIDTTIQPPNT